ncbi:metallopeptidase M20 [Aspergillus niger]|nr:metallopeptidase M20 [Aspergillus niger]
MLSNTLDQVFTKIDQLSQHFITDRLAKAVGIQSVSSDLTTEGRTKVDQEAAGHTAVLKLPDVILANHPATPDLKKRTVLIYGHYDVQPEGDGWTHPAWELTEVNGKLYGRGSTDDKGPVLAWLSALEAYQKAEVDVPVNLRLCFEGMEESGLVRFSEFAQEHKDIFTKFDAACISDNYWLTTRKPCLTYGLRDINYFTITIAQKPLPGHEPVPLHSGIYRGTVHEPMTELVIMLSKLADSNGNILIPGINGLVDDVTPDEIAQYEDIDFDMDEFRSTIGSEAAIYATAKDTLMHRWRYPSITIHGINGADPSPNQTTAIYPKVTGKFSIRTVPTMEGKAVMALVVHYLEQEFKKPGSTNTCKVKQFGESAPYWVANTEDSDFAAGRAATNRVYNTKPDLTREGGSIGVTLDIQNALGHDKSIMLLPVGRSDDGAHGPDEKLDSDNHITERKLLGAYWWYFANA